MVTEWSARPRRAAVMTCRADGAAFADALDRAGYEVLVPGDGELSDLAEVDLVAVEVGGTSDDDAAMLLQVDAERQRRDCGLVVAFPLDALDLVAATITSPAELLCAPTMFDRVAAIGVARHRSPALFHDRALDRDHDRISRLAEEVARIAATLATIATTLPETESGNGGVSDGMIGYRAPTLPDERARIRRPSTLTAATVRTLIRRRRLRDRFFEPSLFADAGWDMLLDLMAARLERRRVAVSSLCIAAAVPPTTALRAIATMVDAGLFVRVADPHDRRRIFIELSDKAASAMEEWFAAVAEA